eukprot:757412-Hanusia_phi.AAC.2
MGNVKLESGVVLTGTGGKGSSSTWSISRGFAMATLTMLMLAASTAEAFMVVGGGSGSVLRRGSQAFVAPALRRPSFSTAGRVRRFTAENAALGTSMAAKKIAVGIVGPGLVGGELLNQFEKTKSILAKSNLDLQAVRMANQSCCESNLVLACRRKCSR